MRVIVAGFWRNKEQFKENLPQSAKLWEQKNVERQLAKIAFTADHFTQYDYTDMTFTFLFHVESGGALYGQQKHSKLNIFLCLETFTSEMIVLITQ